MDVVRLLLENGSDKLWTNFFDKVSLINFVEVEGERGAWVEPPNQVIGAETGAARRGCRKWIGGRGRVSRERSAMRVLYASLRVSRVRRTCRLGCLPTPSSPVTHSSLLSITSLACCQSPRDVAEDAGHSEIVDAINESSMGNISRVRVVCVCACVCGARAHLATPQARE